MAPMIPAIFASVLLASTATSSSGDALVPTSSAARDLEELRDLRFEPVPAPSFLELDPELGDDAPLTDEELALIGSLTSSETSSTATATSAAEPRFWLAPAPLPRPTLILPKQHIRESASRSIAEAFEPHPTVVDTARRFIPGDSAAIRGQSGHRVALYIDGIPLHHALTPSRETPGFFTIDPWMLSEAVLERPGALVLTPRGTAGALRLETIRPGQKDGIDVEAEIAARSADRSTSTHAAASLTQGIAAIRVAAGYNDYRPLRISTSSVGADHGSGYQRAAVNARARLFGRSGDPLLLEGGFDFDRLLNVLRTDNRDIPGAIDRQNQRFLVFSRAFFGSEDLGGSLTLSRQSFLRSFSTVTDPRIVDEEAVSYFLRGSAEVRILEALTLRAGGVVELSNGTAQAQNGNVAEIGDTQLFDAYGGFDLSTDRVRASAQVMAVHNRSASLFAETIEDTRALSQGSVRVGLFGPLGVRAGWTQNVYVPTLQDLRDAVRPLGPETSLAFDFGPSLYGRDGWIELLGFYTFVNDAIEPESLASRRLISIDDVRILGVELTGGFFLMKRLRIAGSLTWSEGQDTSTGAPVVTFPSVTGRGSVRYEIGKSNAYLEAHVRGSTDPIYITSLEGAAPPASLSGLAPTSFARFGVGGGLDLGLGFHASMMIENILDTAHRASASLVPGSGVDVRVALSYALQ